MSAKILSAVYATTVAERDPRLAVPSVPPKSHPILSRTKTTANKANPIRLFPLSIYAILPASKLAAQPRNGAKSKANRPSQTNAQSKANSLKPS